MAVQSGCAVTILGQAWVGQSQAMGVLREMGVIWVAPGEGAAQEPEKCNGMGLGPGGGSRGV